MLVACNVVPGSLSETSLELTGCSRDTTASPTDFLLLKCWLRLYIAGFLNREGEAEAHCSPISCDIKSHLHLSFLPIQSWGKSLSFPWDLNP